MNEDFVTYELAKKLKEKGFREPCLLHYESTGGFYSNSIDSYDRPNQELDYSDFLKCFNEGNSIGLIDAPTILQVLKWLRKEKKIYVSILPFATHSTINKVAFYYLIEYNSTGETMEGIEQNTYCAEWEDAAIAGIEYVLDNLI